MYPQHGGGIHARSGALLSVKKSVITDNLAASVSRANSSAVRGSTSLINDLGTLTQGAGISLWGNSVGLIEASEVTHNEALLEVSPPSFL